MTGALVDNEFIETIKLSDDVSKHTGKIEKIEIIQKSLGIFKQTL